MDYEKLGFKCGVEIHQQLETEKLFCSCPSKVHDDNPDLTVRRRLRAVKGEKGEIDIAASYEEGKDKEFVYEGCSTSSCLVELDEEPPHSVNPEALKIALEISMLVHATIVDHIRFMRKIVIDGSNVSGFQRTALIAVDGSIDTSLGKVTIPTICLEEESAKKIKEGKGEVTYRLDRLGVPLIEIGTDASIKNPEHAKEVAEKIGLVLRSTGKVKRGLGTIRQDVNVSIKGGARTEIKGFQDLRSIPKVIEYEIQRQITEIHSGKPMAASVRKAENDLTTSFLRPMPGADRMYPETDVPSITITKELLSSIELPELLSDKAKKLEGFGLDKELSLKIAKSGKQEYFEELFSLWKQLKPAFIIDTFISVRKQLQRDFSIPEESISDKHIEDVLEMIDTGLLPKNNLAPALADIITGKFDIARYKGVSDEELEIEVKKIISEKPGMNPGVYMGMIMKRFSGKVDGKKAMEIVKKHL
jgi:Glu-tRNA(Gln) amidotransferase subunit E-like FAD-binding protein